MTDAGMMGLQFSDLDLITEYEFNLYRAGYQKREIAFWERARYQSWITVATQTSNPPKIYDLLPLPGDEERKSTAKKVKPIAKVSKKFQEEVFKSLGLQAPWQEGLEQRT